MHAQLGQTYGVIMTEPVRIRYPDFVSLLAAGEEDERVTRLREAETIAGRLVRPSSISWSVRRDAPPQAWKARPSTKDKRTVTVMPCLSGPLRELPTDTRRHILPQPFGIPHQKVSNQLQLLRIVTRA